MHNFAIVYQFFNIYGIRNPEDHQGVKKKIVNCFTLQNQSSAGHYWVYVP